MKPFFLADTTALLEIEAITPADELPEVMEALREKVVAREFGFPGAVIDDLKTRARYERITPWAIGIRDQIKHCSPDFAGITWFARHAQVNLGYDEGLVGLGESDPIIVPVAAMAHKLSQQVMPFQIVSHDIGSVPLRPTMEQVCADQGWTMISMQECLIACGIQLPV